MASGPAPAAPELLPEEDEEEEDDDDDDDEEEEEEELLLPLDEEEVVPPEDEEPPLPEDEEPVPLEDPPPEEDEPPDEDEDEEEAPAPLEDDVPPEDEPPPAPAAGTVVPPDPEQAARLSRIDTPRTAPYIPAALFIRITPPPLVRNVPGSRRHSLPSRRRRERFLFTGGYEPWAPPHPGYL